jgi:hypothetical protein
MHAVLYQHIAMAIVMASNGGCIFYCRIVACLPGSRWGNMEQILAQWQGPATSSAALNMLCWAMHTALHPRIRIAIEMARNKVTLDCHCHFFA